MAGTDPGGGPPRRRFVTRRDVEEAAAAGEVLRLGDRDVLTHEAAARARDLGVAVERGAGSRQAVSGAGGGRAVPPDAALRAAVRSAVVAELGREPAGLDEVIDRVMSRGV